MQTDHYQNVITLLKQYIQLQNKKKGLAQQLQSLNDDLETIDLSEKLEEEINFITSYSTTIMDQVTVIINENNVQNIPSLDDLSLQVSS